MEEIVGVTEGLGNDDADSITLAAVVDAVVAATGATGLGDGGEAGSAATGSAGAAWVVGSGATGSGSCATCAGATCAGAACSCVACAGAACSGARFSCAAAGGAGTSITAEQTEQRARTPPAGTLLGSSSNSVRHEEHCTTIGVIGGHLFQSTAESGSRIDHRYACRWRRPIPEASSRTSSFQWQARSHPRSS